MKKVLLAVAAISMSLAACTTTTGTSTGTTAGTAATIGSNIFKAAVDNQCRTELNSNNAWRALALTMTAEQQTAMETKICSCVSEKAPQNVTAVDLATAAVDQNARAQIVANTVAKTLTACYSEFVK
ncbi:hypothetical protein SAMN05421749_101591 [Acinetobacter marinus]|uniref:Lipoprotein n=1 Tax=Acinetobacter marinus TaxID=281375 RepID=A0A1G6H1S8_9GAMM|nr:hypothetical protein [Acinetobacter marinus]SDB87346.1 hypothetical protein SAMN05421749_101591 [Acinetobacter marinus]